MRTLVQQNNEKLTEIDNFFKAMASTVSKFRPRIQIEVKKEMMAILSQYELKELEENES